MIVYLIMVLCCLVINIIMAFIFHNSRLPNGKKCTLNLATWLVFGLTTVVPLINVVFTVGCIIGLSLSYCDGDYIIQEDSWLGKRY